MNPRDQTRARSFCANARPQFFRRRRGWFRQDARRDRSHRATRAGAECAWMRCRGSSCSLSPTAPRTKCSSARANKFCERNPSPEILTAFNRAWFGTIHAFCLKLLNDYGHYLGLPAPLELITDDDDLWNEFVQQQTRVGRSLSAENRAAASATRFACGTSWNWDARRARPCSVPANRVRVRRLI